jgi:hypothetical protein
MIESPRAHYARVLAIFACYVLSLLIVKPWGDFPLNDDWCYARDCIESARAGRLVLTKFEYAWSLPQLFVGTVVTKLFGFSFTTLRATGIISLAICALLIDLYLRRVGLSSSNRLIAVGAWLFNPIAYVLSLGFMTDLPFLALWLTACYCWDMALTTEERRWFALALVATLLATAQRQFGLFIPIAACAFVLMRWKIQGRHFVLRISLPAKFRSFEGFCLLALGLTILLCLVVSIWYTSLGVLRPPLIAITYSPKYYVTILYRVGLIFALSSIPLLPVLARPVLSRRTSCIAAVLSLPALVFGARFLAMGKFPLFDNLISEFGLHAGPDGRSSSLNSLVLLGRRGVIFGATWSRVVDFIGLLAILLMIRLFCGAPWTRPHRNEQDPRELDVPDRPAGVRDDGFGGVVMLAGAMLLPIFLLRGVCIDRYLLPTVPSVWVALARCGATRSPARKVASVILIGTLAAFSITIASDYFRWNEAKWAAAEGLDRRGVPARRIQAGYEWGGFKGIDVPWPRADISGFDYVIAFSRELEGCREIDAIPWESIWPPHDRRIYVLKNERSYAPETTRGDGAGAQHLIEGELSNSYEAVR